MGIQMIQVKLVFNPKKRSTLVWQALMLRYLWTLNIYFHYDFIHIFLFLWWIRQIWMLCLPSALEPKLLGLLAWSCISDTSGEMTKATGAGPAHKTQTNEIKTRKKNLRLSHEEFTRMSKLQSNLPNQTCPMISVAQPWLQCVWCQWRSTNAGKMKQPLLPRMKEYESDLSRSWRYRRAQCWWSPMRTD